MSASAKITHPSQLRIVYAGAELLASTHETFQRLILNPLNPKTAILYAEVDMAEDGRFEHRASLWTGRKRKTAELAVRFEDATVIAVRFQGQAATVI
jgi:hypothetical protein